VAQAERVAATISAWQASAMTDSERPPVWIGHVSMTVTDPARSHEFYVGLGMRSVFTNDDIAITELRGGTHLILHSGAATPGPAPFDLMVEDLAATHSRVAASGVDVSAISTNPIHDSFTITDPDGYVIGVSNSHVVGIV
jgi:catechol 2,3-dioxygenase-like lactoylglutathione lyase family enzyme